MRSRTVALAGEEYPLRFSLRVVKTCAEKYGSLEGMFEAIQGRAGLEAVDACLWLLDIMLDAGYRYNKANGLEALPPPDGEALLDLLDLPELQALLLGAIAGDSARTVEAEPPNNAGGEAAETDRSS